MHSKISDEQIFGAFLLILMMLALLVYVQGYATEIKANPNITSTTKAFIGYVPLILTIAIFVASITLIVYFAWRLKPH